MPGRDDLSVYRSAAPLAAFVMAHGAGAGQRSGFMVAAAEALASRGVVTATFDFPYVREGRRVPDRAPVLEEAWRAAIAAAQAAPELAGLPLFIGGKSMGGRIASQVAVQDDRGLAGLVFLGYPLHPPGKPQERRDRHLPAINVPMLFVQGTRDTFGTAEEIRGLLPRLNRFAVLYEVDGGDHSFKAPARIRSVADVMAGIYDEIADFMRSVIG